MAGTKAQVRDSHRDRRPPSAQWGPEEGEGDNPGSFTQMKSRDTDTESEDTTPGRDSWRSARGREAVLLTTPRTRGQGKRSMDRGGPAVPGTDRDEVAGRLLDT